MPREFDSQPSAPPDYQLSHQTPLGEARFAPGRIFAGRYRVVSLLGRGAMGEVYRADDLRLGQPVALKLLATAGDRAHEDRVRRFVDEVRLARNIAHPNVCRVYDIGQAEGWHYLSMEYVDGETLASLLRRIGRLPTEKAIDIARQLCAGLAAAHDLGVLHRDIKPSNVMLDGKGRVRLTDFGLAVPASESLIGDVAGTPAYMAPEQLAGDRATERTDIYALGLVLYELFTGRQLFPAASFDARVRIGYDAPSLAAGVAELDPAVAAVITSCLRRDPAARPASALTVATSLPGADSLSAAVSEGRLLSPDLIGAAEQRGVLPPVLAWPLFGVVLAGLILAAVRARDAGLFDPSLLPKPPEALAERARDILARVGHDGERGDSEYWFVAEWGPDQPRGTASQTPPRSIRFVYRQSPSYLLAQNLFRLVTDTDPSPTLPGMATVVTDADGRLIRLSAVRTGPTTSSSRVEADWTLLFVEAGLDPRRFTETGANHSVPVAFDHVRGWSDGSGATVIGASLGGAPVYFEASTQPAAAFSIREAFSSGRSPVADAVVAISLVVVSIVAGVFARQSWRRGEGDRRGARRLGLFTVGASLMLGMLRTHHVPVPYEQLLLFLSILGWSLMWGGFVWMLYLGLEPYVRRRWPRALVSWTRLLSGNMRDAMVGRDILLGMAFGILLLMARLLFTGRLAPNEFLTVALEGVRSVRHLMFVVGISALEALEYAMAGLLFLVLAQRIFRSVLLAAVFLALVTSPIVSGGFVDVSWGLRAFALLAMLAAAVVVLRLGLLPWASALFVVFAVQRYPITLDTNAWYFASSLVLLAVLGGLALYAAMIAVGSKSAAGERNMPRVSLEPTA